MGADLLEAFQVRGDRFQCQRMTRPQLEIVGVQRNLCFEVRNLLLQFKRIEVAFLDEDTLYQRASLGLQRRVTLTKFLIDAAREDQIVDSQGHADAQGSVEQAVGAVQQRTASVEVDHDGNEKNAGNRDDRTVLDEFFRTTFRTKFYESVESLQVDLDKWLVHYNTERPRQGYRNMGRRPVDTINLFVQKDANREA